MSNMRMRSMLRTTQRSIAGAIDTFSRVCADTRVVPARDLWQIQEENYLRQFLKAYNIDCVFDIGANDGQYATMLRKKAGYQGKIISFEPIPEMAETLRQRAKNDGNWFVEEAAVSDHDGSTKFNIMSRSTFSSIQTPSQAHTQLFDDMNVVSRSIEVRTTTLTTAYTALKSKHGFIRPFLKMDTQGHDLQVWESGVDIVTNFVGVQSELSFTPIYEGMPPYGKVLQTFESAGFVVGKLVSNDAGHFPRLIEMDCIMLNPRFEQDSVGTQTKQ